MCYNIDMKLTHNERGERVKNKAREYYNMVKSHSSCMCCDTKDGIQFHHVNPNNKRMEVSLSVSYSLNVLKKEMKKCWVMCEECHKKLHLGVLCILPEFYDGY